jgi:hypothetical protein
MGFIERTIEVLGLAKPASPDSNLPMLVQTVPYELLVDPVRLASFTELSKWREKNYGDRDAIRVFYFMRLIELVAKLPDGDYIEMGTQYGGTAKLIYEWMQPDRQLYCFDTFVGFPQVDLDAEFKVAFHGFTTDSIQPLAMEKVHDIITDNKSSDRLNMIAGRVPETLPPYNDHCFRFAHLDMDLYEPTRAALEWLWPRMVPGAIILLHDYPLPGVRKAVDDFVAPLAQIPIPMGDRFGSIVIYKPK